jgi:hypothetical protein
MDDTPQIKLTLRDAWRYMWVLPWKQIDGEPQVKGLHSFIWLTGWLWAISGVFAGSLLSLWLLGVVPDVGGTSYETPFVIGISLAFGFAIQLYGWLLMVYNIPVISIHTYINHRRFVIMITPFIMSGLLIFYFLHGLGSEFGLASRGVLGAFALKIAITVVPSMLKSLVGGLILGRIAKWLGADRVKRAE